jgi:hypothetical protein
LIYGERAKGPAPVEPAAFEEFPEDIDVRSQTLKVESPTGGFTNRTIQAGWSKGVERGGSPGSLGELIQTPAIGFLENPDGGFTEVLDVDHKVVHPNRVDQSQLLAGAIEKLRTADRVVALVGVGRTNSHADKAGHVCLLYGYRDAEGCPVVRFIEPQDLKEPIHTDITGIGTFLTRENQQARADVFSPVIDVYPLFAPPARFQS